MSRNCAETMTQEDQHDPTPVESGNPDTTPTNSGNVGDTPPEAEPKTGTTQEPAEHDVEKIVKKRLERERKKWEAELEEAKKRARMDETERLKAELADRDKAIAEAQAQTKRERTLRSLTADKVADAEDALLIAEHLGLVDEDGGVDLPALLKAKPHLAPQGPTRAATTGASGSISTRQAKVAGLQEQLANAKTRQERVSLQRQIAEHQKG